MARAAEAGGAARTAVITGAAGGIGQALARRFGRGGYRLGLLDRDEAALQALASELALDGVEALALPCDVTSRQQCETTIATVLQAYGGIDVLVNNAGVTHISPFAETDESIYRKLLDINVLGAVRCTQAALASLCARRGTIVVVSSVAGFSPLANRSGYAASKHALHGLFETVRAELKPRGVKVLIVCPGFTRTAIEEHALGSGVRPPRHRSTVGRIAEPEEVAEAIYRGVVRGRRLLVLSATGRLAYLLSRVSPSLYEQIMLRSLQRDEARAASADRSSRGHE